MSLRFSLGSRWFELYLWQSRFDVVAILEVKYGHNSQRNLVSVIRRADRTWTVKWRNLKTRRLG